MVKKSIAALVLAAALGLSSTAEASMMTYAYLVGQKTGQVKGGITQKGREDSIGIIALEHHARLDPRGKEVAGRGGAFVVTKELDKSSPVLRSILDTGENLTSATFRFWTPQLRATTGVGSEVQHYTVKLTNAKITSIKFVQPNIRHPDLVKFAEYEEVTLTYEKAEWTWNDGGITTVEAGGGEPPAPPPAIPR